MKMKMVFTIKREISMNLNELQTIKPKNAFEEWAKNKRIKYQIKGIKVQ